MFSSGFKVNGYKLERKLGSGGFATVWQAEHPEHGTVAVKVLHPELLRRKKLEHGPSVSQRFLAEADIIQQLDYPGFVRIVEHVVAEEASFVGYSMELLRGRNLAQWVREIPLSAIFLVMAVVADTLQRLHDAQIIHRDIKASNIFLCQTTGEENKYGVKLIDFGVAKELSQERMLESTAPGYFIGTVARMPPECFLRWKSGGETVFGPKVDQWGFGVTLFYLLSGVMPYREENMIALIQKIEQGQRRELSFQSRFRVEKPPSIVEDFFSRCLALNPEDRFLDMAEVAAKLRQLAERSLSASMHTLYEHETVVSQLSQWEKHELPLATELMEINAQRLRTAGLDITVDAEEAGAVLELDREEQQRGMGLDSTFKNDVLQGSYSAAGEKGNTDQGLVVGRRRLLVTSEGKAIPVNEKLRDDPKLNREAIAKTHITKGAVIDMAFSSAAGEQTSRLEDSKTVLEEQVNSRHRKGPKVSESRSTPSSSDFELRDTIVPGQMQKPQISKPKKASFFLIGAVCVLSGFLSYMVVWWLRRGA